MFAIKSLKSIYDIFPEIILTENPPHFKAVDTNGNEHLVRCSYLESLKRWKVDIDRVGASDWEEFVECQKILHDIYLELCNEKDEKEIFRKIVEEGILKLNIDRIGIVLFSIEDNLMVGSWGTDDNGNIVDQSDFKSNLDNEKWCLDALKRRNYVAVNYDDPLRNMGKDIGYGWNAVAAFYDGDKPIGWVACDNYFSKAPLLPWKKEIIGELGRITGRLISRTRQETRLQTMVDERTKSLEERQEQLIEAEKLASLGALVAGVSHELNTPVGIALTAASHIEESTTHIKEKFEHNELRKKELIDFFNVNIRSGKITVSALKKASDLVNSFKRLAVDRSAEVKADINLYDLIETIAISLRYNQPNISVTFNNNVDRELHIFSYTSDFIQIFSNLIQNSIMHGFKGESGGTVTIASKVKKHTLKIKYSDDGTGLINVDKNRIFEPFYSTRRNKGGVGLGLSIVYNLVTKLDGTIKVSNGHKGLSFELNFDLNKLT